MSETRELDEVFDELPPNVQQELQALEEIVYQQKQRIAELEQKQELTQALANGFSMAMFKAEAQLTVLEAERKALMKPSEVVAVMAENTKLREAVSEYVDTLSPNAFNKMARLLESSDE